MSTHEIGKSKQCCREVPVSRVRIPGFVVLPHLKLDCLKWHLFPFIDPPGNHHLVSYHILLIIFIPQTNDWRLSYINKDFSVCPSYPPIVTVPKSIDDESLCKVATFRHGGRFPVLSYYHKKNGMVSWSLTIMCAWTLVLSLDNPC